MEKLDRGDTLIDCCDMSYKESALNAKMMARAGISYLGTGLCMPRMILSKDLPL